MELSLSVQRVLALVVGCLNISMAGLLLTFGAWCDDLKSEFNLEQSSVEVIASMGALGASLGYPMGLLYERLGPRRSYAVTIVIGTTGALLMYSTQFAVDFYSHNWGLLALYWTVYGFAILLMFIIPLTVLMGNFPPRHRGFLVGATGACWWLGSATYAAVYSACFSGSKSSVGNFFLMIAILTFCVNAVAFWVVHPVEMSPADGVAEYQSLLKEPVDESTTKEAETFSDRYGINLLYVPEFYMVTWGFLLAGCVQATYIPNISTFSHSYHLSQLNTFLTVFSPVCASTAKLVFGFLSDRTKEYFPRIFYIILMNILQSTVLLFSIFYGDNKTMFVITTVIVYMTNGTFFSIMPTIVSEYFGMRHFSRNWGFTIFGNALFGFALLAVYGSLYSNNIMEMNSNYCYGLQCFEDFYIFAAILSLVALGLFLWLFIRDISGKFSGVVV